MRLPDGRIPVLLSAHEDDLIAQDAAAIGNYLRREPTVAAVASTLLRIRRVRRHRAVVRAADNSELAAGLAALVNGDEHPWVARSSPSSAPRTAFVFPGQGNQWPAMGADAYRQLPAYRAEVDRCGQAFAAAGLASPLPYLVAGPERQWSQIDIQAAQFTHAAGLAQVWRSCGILPDVTIGHSLGEVAAAYVAGGIALAEAVAVVAARTRVVDELAGRYGMAVLGVGIADAHRLIAETPGWLEVSVVNSVSSTGVSGDRDAVAAIVQTAERCGVFVREIDVDFPGHTSALDSVRAALRELLPAPVFLDAPVEFIGSARGAAVGPGDDVADYWYENLRNTVRFDRAVATAVERGIGRFVEMSAHPSLLYALADLVGDTSIVGSGRRDQPVVDQLSANIAAAALADPGYRWADLAGADQTSLPGFPNAPMRSTHFWATPQPVSALTVAVEEWEPREAAGRVAGNRCGVAITGSGGDSLTRRLTEAVGAHPDAHPVPLDEAEIAVVIAPDAAVAFDYRRAVGPRCRRVWLVTVAGERVRSGDPVGSPAQAALAAMHRCVGLEYPDHTFAHLDLPHRGIHAEAALACVDVLLDEDDVEVALRGPRRYVRVLREQDVPEHPLNSDVLDTVVITGASGTVGSHYARYCVEHGARRLILLSRKGIDLTDLDRLSNGRAVEVYAPACDIADGDAVSAVAAEYAGGGASLLIHAAGVARFNRHDQLTDADLAAVFGAKVTGLARMIEIWPLRQDARILLCSSVSGVWGGYGHAAYAASNRLLDVFAGQLRAQGRDAVAVRWGLWPGTGIVGRDEITRIERSGLIAMDPDAAIDASLRHHDGDPLIFAADCDRLRVFFESQRTPADPEQPLAETVHAELVAALSLPGSAAVDLNAGLIDLGLDSLLALDLGKRLRRRTGRTVAMATLLGGMTGAELIDALGASSDD